VRGVASSSDEADEVDDEAEQVEEGGAREPSIAVRGDAVVAPQGLGFDATAEEVEEVETGVG